MASTTPSQIPWDVVFKMHMASVESHVKMLELMKEHTVADSNEWATISSLIERGQNMTTDVKMASVAVLGENNLFDNGAASGTEAGPRRAGAGVGDQSNVENTYGNNHAQQTTGSDAAQGETGADRAAATRKRRLEEDAPAGVDPVMSPKRLRSNETSQTESDTIRVASRKRRLENDGAVDLEPVMSPKRLRICDAPTVGSTTDEDTLPHETTETSATTIGNAPPTQLPSAEYEDISHLVDARVRYWNKQLFGQTAEKREAGGDEQEPARKRMKEVDASIEETLERQQHQQPRSSRRSCSPKAKARATTGPRAVAV